MWAANLWRRKSLSFNFDGKSYRYFYHPYNLTWLNERCVEIPIARDLLEQHQGKNILEVGNVLSRYNPNLTHTVVDKYERSDRPNYFVEDAETFDQGGPYDLILSISTLEHVGWDELPRDPDKIARTIQHLRSLLSSNGKLLFTAPIGYSPPLDLVVGDLLNRGHIQCLQRINVLNEWVETTWSEASNNKFHAPYPFANGLMVITLGGH